MTEVTLDELIEDPASSGFKFVACDKCGGAWYAEDMTPETCFGCLTSSPPMGGEDDNA